MGARYVCIIVWARASTILDIGRSIDGGASCPIPSISLSLLPTRSLRQSQSDLSLILPPANASRTSPASQVIPTPSRKRRLLTPAATVPPAAADDHARSCNLAVAAGRATSRVLGGGSTVAAPARPTPFRVAQPGGHGQTRGLAMWNPLSLFRQKPGVEPVAPPPPPPPAAAKEMAEIRALMKSGELTVRPSLCATPAFRGAPSATLHCCQHRYRRCLGLEAKDCHALSLVGFPFLVP